MKTITMFRRNGVISMLLVILCVVVKENCSYYPNESCWIRFYAVQYFRGNYWTLDSNDTWTSSRYSYFTVPYRNFKTKSIRTYGSRLCTWQICPLRTRKNFNLPRWKKCKTIAGGNELNSLRNWGWPYYIIGRVYKLTNKRARSRKLESRSSEERSYDTTGDKSPTSSGTFQKSLSLTVHVYFKIYNKFTLCVEM